MVNRSWIAGVLALMLPIAAQATEPAVDVAQDGTVEVRMIIGATEMDIREVIDDTDALATLSPDVLSVESEAQGRCDVVTRSTRGLFRPFRFRALRCPTPTGWEESLIDSGDFSAYSTEWVVIESAYGTEVIYRVHTELNAFPTALVRKSVIQSARDQLVKLARKVVGK